MRSSEVSGSLWLTGVITAAEGRSGEARLMQIKESSLGRPAPVGAGGFSTARSQQYYSSMSSMIYTVEHRPCRSLGCCQHGSVLRWQTAQYKLVSWWTCSCRLPVQGCQCYRHSQISPGVRLWSSSCGQPLTRQSTTAVTQQMRHRLV